MARLLRKIAGGSLLLGTLLAGGVGYAGDKGLTVLRAAPARATSDWIIESSLGSSVSVSDGAFLDGQNGWVIGSGGTMFVIHDDGLDWAKYLSGSGDDLRHIHFLSAQIGYAVGGNTLLHTTDGGVHWQAIQSTTLPGSMTDIRASDPSTMWVTTSPREGNGSIYRSTDGGQSWGSLYDATNGTGFDSLTLAAPSNIWAVGAPGLYHSADNGNSWSPVSADSDNGRANVAAFFGQLGIVAGVIDAQGPYFFIARTTDGGATWQTSKGTHPDAYQVSSVAGVGSSMVLAAQTHYGTESAIFASNDLGAHWVAQSLPSGTDVLVAAGYRGITPWALTKDGYFLHFGPLPPADTATPTPYVPPTQTPIPSPTPTAAAVVPFGSVFDTPTVTPTASPIPQPLCVLSLSPKVVVAGSSAAVTIHGGGFDAQVTVSVGDSDITDAQLTSGGLRFNLPPTVPPGLYDVRVQLDSGQVGVLHHSLTVVPKLLIDAGLASRTVVAGHLLAFDVRSLPGAVLSAVPQTASGRPVPHIVATLRQVGSGHWRVVLAIGIHVPAGWYRLAIGAVTSQQRATAMPGFTALVGR